MPLIVLNKNKEGSKRCCQRKKGYEREENASSSVTIKPVMISPEPAEMYTQGEGSSFV